jgi:hypothetical protein
MATWDGDASNDWQQTKDGYGVNRKASPPRKRREATHEEGAFFPLAMVSFERGDTLSMHIDQALL